MNDKSKLHFDEGEAVTAGGATTSGQNVPKSKKPHKQFRENSAQAPPSERLHDAPSFGERAGAGTADKKAARDGKRLNHSKLRMERTGAKLEKAVDKKAKQKPYKRPGAIKSVQQVATYEGVRYIHGKIHQNEHENVGVEAAHKTELAGERGVRATSRFVKERSRTRPVRRVRKWEKRNMKAKADFQYKQTVQENPALGKNAVSRFIQKQKNKKRYQKQAKQAAKRGAKTAKKTAVTTEKIIAAIGRFAVRHPVLTLIVVAVFLLIVIMQSLMGTVTMMGNGMTGAIGAASYLAEDADIDRADLTYTEWETDLQLQINNMETTRPGYDEYRYSVGTIGHDPYALMAFLTAVYDNFTYSDVESALQEIFNEHYTLTTREITETRTETRTVEAGEPIGQVRTTAYCACAVCCGPYADGITASGTRATANRTIAVDAYNPIVPMGTTVIINSVTYTVEDTGNLAANRTDFDIYFSTHEEAMTWGRQTHSAYFAADSAGEVTETTEVRILEITLTVRPFADLLNSRMNAEQLERYNILVMTKGNRQYLKSPFDINWLPYVSSNYGYRVHPIDGTKNYHTGVDIALPEGTVIMAGQTGTVTFSGEDGGYGLIVVIDDGQGLVSKYAHCSALLVSAGQTVQAGDAIAKIGNTGNSTGPHLHIEIIRNGQYLNPLYFAFTNDIIQ